MQQSNFDQTMNKSIAEKGKVILKDEYNLDFLGIEEEVLEKDVERGILRHIDQFIREMGNDFMFAGNQKRLEVGDQEYFIDFLFYHKKLRSYIVIELKSGKFKPEYVGKMALYLGAVEDQLNDEDNPAIGIILCTDKNREVVDTSLKMITRPVGVATYKTYDRQDKLPEEYAKYLPNPEIIAQRLLELLA
ncbi:MAG: PDDEXK nuclease domain-containing protein [Candidatus Dojkabacteria bacterium]